MQTKIIIISVLFQFSDNKVFVLKLRVVFIWSLKIRNSLQER